MYVDAMSSSIYAGEEKVSLWSVENKDGMEIGTEKEKEVSKCSWVRGLSTKDRGQLVFPKGILKEHLQTQRDPGA